MVQEEEIIIGPREQLFHLLAETSEIEHTLMCTYLYAGFSLKRGKSFPSHQSAAIERWRTGIMAVAQEEMVHLLLVSNLSIALGMRPHFSRPNFPVAAGYFPSGVVAKLTPFSLDTLDHFIFLERPLGSHREDADGFEPTAPSERAEAHHGFMPSVQNYATIGELYEAIRVNLEAAAARLGDKLFVGPMSAQLGPDVAQMPGVATISDLPSALAALDLIVEQGEGSRADSEDSHHHRFLAIRAEYAKLLDDDPAFAPAWPVAESPVMRNPPDPAGKIFIDDRDAARVLDFANAVYGLLLRLLVQAFGRAEEPGNAGQLACIDGAIQLMHVLAKVSTALCQLPASATAPGINAGMTFTTLRGAEGFFLGTAESQLLTERVEELLVGAREMAQILPELRSVEPILVALVARKDSVIAIPSSS